MPAPGTLAAAPNYAYRISAVSASGESIASDETPLITHTANGATSLLWSAIPGAMSYNIYGRTTSGPTLVTATTGGALAGNTTYGYRVTTLSAPTPTVPAGESTPCAEALIAVPQGTYTNTVTVSWNAVAGAIGYNVYGRFQGKEQLMATWNGTAWISALDGSTVPGGTATSFIDTGSSRVSSDQIQTQPLPTVNTAGLLYPNAQLRLANVTSTTYLDTGAATPAGSQVVTNTSGFGILPPPQFVVNTAGPATGEGVNPPSLTDPRWFPNPKGYGSARLYTNTSAFASASAWAQARLWTRSGRAAIGHFTRTDAQQFDLIGFGGSVTDQSYFDLDLNGDDLLITVDSFNTNQDVRATGATAVTMTAYRIELYVSLR
jgi:hypothetical protein